MFYLKLSNLLEDILLMMYAIYYILIKINYDIYLIKEYIESALLCCPLKEYRSKVIEDPNINKSP